MRTQIKTMVECLIPIGIKQYLKKKIDLMLIKSLEKAINEQGLMNLVVKLEEIVPDIKNQYSDFLVNTLYLKKKVRGLHAFQISLINEAIKDIENPVIVDIGDSSGTHLQYITGLHSKDKNIKCLSVNLDAKAIERIRIKGLEAVHSRAEDLQSYDINTDIFLCFEVLEHLMNPCLFLHELSLKTNAKYLIITVPYLKRSRVGLHHIRNNNKEYVSAEKTHLFEFSPQDWKLIIGHAGWSIITEIVYLQYPKKDFLYITKPLWKKFDFEGFYGLILKRENSWSSRYLDW
jgi:hypothetical protein